MQETTYRDRDGEIKQFKEMFMVPGDQAGFESAMRQRYQNAMKKVFADGGELISIKQGKIGRNDPCPCGSGRKFKKCCENRMNTALNQTAAE